MDEWIILALFWWVITRAKYTHAQKCMLVLELFLLLELLFQLGSCNSFDTEVAFLHQGLKMFIAGDWRAKPVHKDRFSITASSRVTCFLLRAAQEERGPGAWWDWGPTAQPCPDRPLWDVWRHRQARAGRSWQGSELGHVPPHAAANCVWGGRPAGQAVEDEWWGVSVQFETVDSYWWLCPIPLPLNPTPPPDRCFGCCSLSLSLSLSFFVVSEIHVKY